MKAIVCDEYGAPNEVLRLTDMAQPAIGDDDVLVRVLAASVNPADWHLVRGTPYIARLQLGLRKPRWRILGCDVAGRVEAVGPNVTTLRPGDEVFGSLFMRGFGAFAELVSVPEQALEQKPANLSFEQAAAVPLGAITALQGLRAGGGLVPGRRVLIIGASGGVGTFAVQIATALGAEVTGVCGTSNVDLVRSLGAGDVIDYSQGNIIQGESSYYDLVLQVAGTDSPSECRRVLSPEGTLVQISGDSDGHWIGAVTRLVRARLLSPFVSQTLMSLAVKPAKGDLRTLKELLEAGDIAPVIDRTYQLGDVPDALGYLEQGHARGKVVVTI
jgi:NADPH:quinone reductase-like Zn-dependent oxidoreductase